MTTRTIADSLKSATATMRKRDVINMRQADKATESKAARLKPTPEQMGRATFEKVVGSDADGAYRRLPLFETLFKRCDFIGQPELMALRWYRDSHDSSAASPTRCALNDEGRGGGVPICIPFALAGLRVEDLQYGSIVGLIERALGQALPTMRAVVLEDKSFSTVAIERFGGRKVSWIEQEKARGTDRKGHKLAYVDKVAPQSGRHRQVIADEFRAGLTALVAAHQPYVSTARPERVAVPVSEAEAALMAMVAGEGVPAPVVDPEFLDDAGRMREMSDIAAIIRARMFGTEQMAA